MIPDECTPRCRQFLAELDALCTGYDVYLTPSGYDMLQIWRRRRDHPGGFDWDAIEDRTPVDGVAEE
jgi:hypothetical protein